MSRAAVVSDVIPDSKSLACDLQSFSACINLTSEGPALLFLGLSKS